MSKFIGIVTSVEKLSYIITADIPGVINGIKAYPCRDVIDEPTPGDHLLLECLDPTYNSYYTYRILKEDDFIGFRSNGKVVSVTPDDITVGIYNGSDYSNCKASVRIENDGTINIMGDNIKLNGEEYSSVRYEELESILLDLLQYLSIGQVTPGPFLSTSVNIGLLSKRLKNMKSETVKLK